MLWLFFTLLAYALLALVTLTDKFLLSGPMPSPKVYAFWAGSLGLLALALAPFLGFKMIPLPELSMALASGIFFVAGQLALYYGLRSYEASRVTSAVGALIPIFMLGLTFLIFPDEARLSSTQFLAFVFLISGGWTITSGQGKNPKHESIGIALLAALLFALSFAFAKYSYDMSKYAQGGELFWTVLSWTRIGGFLVPLFLLATSKEVRENLGNGIKPPKKQKRDWKTTGLFMLNQAFGATAIVAQQLALFFVPAVYLAFVGALQGVEYIFILILAWLASSHDLVGEMFSKVALRQKINGIALITVGLALLAL